MEKKKSIIIAIIVLIVALTSWVLVVKLSDLQGGKTVGSSSDSSFFSSFGNFFGNLLGSKKSENKPVASEEPVTSEEQVATQGIVQDFSANSLTLKNATGVTTIENSPEVAIYTLEDNKLLKKLQITDLKKDMDVTVVHKESITRKKVNVSNIIWGTVTGIADGKISLETEDGIKTVAITSEPTIYMGDGDQAVDRQAFDIKTGSEITVAYADAETKLQVVGIRIDKL